MVITQSPKVNVFGIRNGDNMHEMPMRAGGIIAAMRVFKLSSHSQLNGIDARMIPFSDNQPNTKRIKMNAHSVPKNPSAYTIDLNSTQYAAMKNNAQRNAE